MNLKCKLTRGPLAALGVAAIASGGLLASPAHAAETLTLNSGGTTPAVANLADEAAAYALKVTNSAGQDLKLGVTSAPAGGRVQAQLKAANAAADALAPVGANEEQTVTVHADSAAGTYTLSFGGQKTAALAWDATAATVQSALAGLSTIGSGNVAVEKAGNVYTVKFQGDLANKNVAALVADDNTIVDGAADPVAAPAVAETKAGAPLALALTGVQPTSNIYVNGDVPGTYKLRIFSDINGNNAYDAADEAGTAEITLTVYDAVANTVSTADDVSPVITASAGQVGVPIVAGITYNKPLSLTDARGAGTSGIAAALAANTFVDVVEGTTGVGDENEAAATYTAATGKITHPVGAPTGAGTVSMRADFSSAGDPGTSAGTANIAVTSNNVATVEQGITAVEGKVKLVGNNVTVRAGEASVTYTAKALDGAGTPAPVAGATVYFTLGGAAVAGLTTNGTPVSGQSNVYTAVTNAQGIASLTVTSAATVNGTTYTVQSSSNGNNSAVFTTTYATPAATTVTSGGDVAATIGGSVVITGKVVDQWGAGIQPAGIPQAELSIDTNDDDWDAGAITRYANIASDGTFNYQVLDTGNTTARTDAYIWRVGGNDSASAQIRWVADVAAGQITLGSLNPDQIGNPVTTFPVPAASDFILGTWDDPEEIAFRAIVKDASGAPLPFAEFTLTGTPGVYFLDANGKAVTTLTSRANANGEISTSGGAAATNGYVNVVLTKSGDDTEITVQAGTATATTGKFTANQPLAGDAWKVGINDVTGEPGESLTLSGRVEDAFGNPVPNVGVQLSISGEAEFGVITSDDTPNTNNVGVFRALFQSGKNDSGIVKIRATINGGAAPDPAAGTVTTTGIAYQAGRNTVEGTVTVENETAVTIQAQESRVGPGEVSLSGTGRAGTPVDIYVKRTGTTDDFWVLTSVTPNAQGQWSTSVEIVRSATFYAQQGTTRSQETVGSTVYSSVKINSKALGGGKVALAADGNPNQATKMSFYTWKNGKLSKIVTVDTTDRGYGSATATLPKGTHVIRAYYVATGTRSAFAEQTLTVK